jgi:hypothetical protein
MKTSVDLFLSRFLKSDNVLLKLDSSKKRYEIYLFNTLVGTVGVKLITKLIDEKKIKISVFNDNHNEENSILLEVA